MEVFPVTTSLALCLSAAVFLLGPVRGFPFLMASLPFGVAAAFNLPAFGGASVLIASLTAAGYLAGVVVRFDCLAAMRRVVALGNSGFWLLLLAYIALGITFLAPRLFEGATPVFSITRDPGESEVVSYVPLGPSTGNLTQGAYFLQSILLFIAIRATIRASHLGIVRRGIYVASMIHLCLGALDLLTYSLGASWMMEVIQTANYSIHNEASMAGLKRIVGGFSEASACGSFTVCLLGFWMGYWRAEGARPVVIPFTGLSLMLIFSTASSAYASFILFCAFALIFLAIRTLLRTIKRFDTQLLTAGGLLLIAIGVSLFLVSLISSDFYDFLDRVLFSKLESESGAERGDWNKSAFQNFLDTFYLGAGLGSVRGSSWLFSLLGTLGIPGLILFSLFFARLIQDYVRPVERKSKETDAIRFGSLAACFSLFINHMLIASTPDLGLTFMIFAALIGLSGGAADGNVNESDRQGQQDNLGRLPSMLAS